MDRRNNETIRRVEEGEERRRAAVPQGTMLIAVAKSGCFAQVELGGGQVKNSEWHRSGTLLFGKISGLFWARKCASSILR